MAQEQAEVRAIPPYVAYKTFRSFLEGLRVAMPSRIDRSLMGTMSGATQGQLLTTLRFLGLITENGSVTAALKTLATSDDEKRQLALQDVLSSAYADVLRDVDLDSGTYKQLQEAFAATGAQGDTVRKCIAFWLLANRDADLVVSPHFGLRGTRAAPSRNAAKRRRSTPQRAQAVADDAEPVPAAAPRTRFEVLMAKFPAFDPAWAPEVQAKWFDAFERIQSLAPADDEA